MSEFIRKEICDGVAFNSIVDTRFKIGRISATLVVPLSRQTASANALLSCVLTRSCRKYPDFTALSRRLDYLYGAALYPSVRRMGDYQAITISAAGLDDRYALDNESVSSELADLLCSILFDPNLTDGLFNEEDVEQERRQLIENIDAEFNDKRTYAINRCIENMCRNEPFSVGRFGNREDVAAISQKSLIEAWQQLLKSARVELAMVGSASPDNAYAQFSSFFSDKPRPVPVFSNTSGFTGEPKKITETEEISQSKLVMGYRTPLPASSRESVASSLMSAILGGTPTSKLFLNVREKQSLCYYCASRVDNFKGILMIDSGVETQNIEKAEAAVSEQLRLLKNGCITDDELNEAKLAIRNAYISSLDSLGALQSFYLNGIIRGLPVSPQEAAEISGQITKDEITELAKQIQPDTVFSLIGN